MSHNKGQTFQYIINLLSKNKIYTIEFELINMVDYGIPQKRVQLCIIGSLKSENLPKFFPIPIYYKKQVIRDL